MSIFQFKNLTDSARRGRDSLAAGVSFLSLRPSPRLRPVSTPQDAFLEDANRLNAYWSNVGNYLRKAVERYEAEKE